MIDVMSDVKSDVIGDVKSDVRITVEGKDGAAQSYALETGESVLDGLLRQGVAVPNSCRAGACQACLMQVTEGTPPAKSQTGLKDAMRARGFFLACSCVPTADLTVRFADHTGRRARAVLECVERLSETVARVLLSCDEPFDYFPGQFVNVVRPEDGLVRSYSLASLHSPDGLPAGDRHLELHVRKVNGGQMSNWLHDEGAVGQTVELRGPAGDCFYVPGRPEQPILLLGTGTGLAPLWAIARDALRHGHTGPIKLYHGGLDASGLYHVDELRALSDGHANFEYVPCVMNGAGEDGVRVGAIDKVVLADLPKLAVWRVYLCGNPDLVNALRKRVYLAGAKMSDIYADAFVTRASA
jgi:NAD(P)H-flavin reductase/ferredoxin